MSDFLKMAMCPVGGGSVGERCIGWWEVSSSWVRFRKLDVPGYCGVVGLEGSTEAVMGVGSPRWGKRVLFSMSQNPGSWEFESW